MRIDESVTTIFHMLSRTLIVFAPTLNMSNFLSKICWKGQLGLYLRFSRASLLPHLSVVEWIVQTSSTTRTRAGQSNTTRLQTFILRLLKGKMCVTCEYKLHTPSLATANYMHEFNHQNQLGWVAIIFKIIDIGAFQQLRQLYLSIIHACNILHRVLNFFSVFRVGHCVYGNGTRFTFVVFF